MIFISFSFLSFFFFFLYFFISISINLYIYIYKQTHTCEYICILEIGSKDINTPETYLRVLQPIVGDSLLAALQ